MREKSFLDILTEKLEKQILESVSERKTMSNFQSTRPADDTFFQRQTDAGGDRTQPKNTFFTEKQQEKSYFSEPWISQIPFQKVEFQRPKSQVFGRVYPINQPRKAPSPNRQKHVLSEKQKQAVIYFWGWQIRLQEDFTQEELKKAFRALAHQLHPDKNAGKTKAFIEMKAHYNCLLSVFSSQA
jgi:hypothetical protein